MGRKLMRVAMDFSWPWNKVWKGYINPYRSIPCTPCDKTGLSPKAKTLDDKWWGREMPLSNGWWGIKTGAWMYNLTQEEVNILVDADHLWDYTRVPVNEAQKDPSMQHSNGWLKEWNGVYPDAARINADTMDCKLGRGVSTGDGYTLIKHYAAKEGWDHLCEFCRGDGSTWSTPEIQKLHEEWKEEEPPIGPGYQLWETTSEGSPQSPVFATLDELCEWCEVNASTFADMRTSKENWKKMLDDGLVYHKEGTNIFI